MATLDLQRREKVKKQGDLHQLFTDQRSAQVHPAMQMPHDKKLSDGCIFWLFHGEAEGCKDSGTSWKSAAEGKAGENGLLVQTLTSKEMLPLPEGSPLITATKTLGIKLDILA